MRVVSSLTGERNGKRDESSAIPDRRAPTSQVPTSMRCKSTRLARQMRNHQRETVYIFSHFFQFFSLPCQDRVGTLPSSCLRDIYIYIFWWWELDDGFAVWNAKLLREWKVRLALQETHSWKIYLSGIGFIHSNSNQSINIYIYNKRPHMRVHKVLPRGAPFSFFFFLHFFINFFLLLPNRL